jgi:hypothetical protein
VSGDLFDRGLQPERTELARRRTALSIAVGSVVAMRLLPAALGSGWWIVPGILGVIFSVVLWAWSRRRYESVSFATVAAQDHTLVPDGALLMTLAVVVTLIGALGVVVLVALPLY